MFAAPSLAEPDMLHHHPKHPLYCWISLIFLPTIPCFPFSYLNFFLLSCVFSEQQGGLRRRVCLAPGLSCCRGLNATETKFLLHKAAAARVCACVCAHTVVKYGHISVELCWLLLCRELLQIAPTSESDLDWMQTWFIWFGQAVIRKKTAPPRLNLLPSFLHYVRRAVGSVWSDSNRAKGIFFC